MKDVATLLRNTPAVCRRCYIHPAVIEAFEADELRDWSPGKARRGLNEDEMAFAAFLAQAEKHRTKRTRRAGANSPKLGESGGTDSINGALPALLKKSRIGRKAAEATTVSNRGAQTMRRTAGARQASSPPRGTRQATRCARHRRC